MYTYLYPYSHLYLYRSVVRGSSLKEAAPGPGGIAHGGEDAVDGDLLARVVLRASGKIGRQRRGPQGLVWYIVQFQSIWYMVNIAHGIQTQGSYILGLRPETSFVFMWSLGPYHRELDQEFRSSIDVCTGRSAKFVRDTQRGLGNKKVVLGCNIYFIT